MNVNSIIDHGRQLVPHNLQKYPQRGAQAILTKVRKECSTNHRAIIPHEQETDTYIQKEPMSLLLICAPSVVFCAACFWLLVSRHTDDFTLTGWLKILSERELGDADAFFDGEKSGDAAVHLFFVKEMDRLAMLLTVLSVTIM